MNRRDFLRASAALASASVLARPALFAQNPQTVPRAATNPAGLVPLRRNVGVFSARGGTIGWLSTPDVIAVVDTQYPDTAAKCLAALVGESGRHVDMVVNTHHHTDHTSGNLVFRPVTKKFVAHKNVPALQRADAERAKPPTVDKQVYADTTFDDTWSVTFPGRGNTPGETLSARYLGPAHTRGDIVVHFENANIVHMGDLVFNRVYPGVDRTGGANLANWINVLETVHRTYPADAIYVFGHGNTAPQFGVTGTRDDLLAMRDYFSALLDHTRRQIASGKPRAEIVALENLPGFNDYHAPAPNRLSSNLALAYDELTNAPKTT